jgi:small subunit ribosomal protein S14
MAKTSMIARENKRAKCAVKSEARRKVLKSVIQNPASSYEDRQSAQLVLQKMPRDASKVRLRNRCALTGRPRGYYRKFGLGRNKLRETVLRGDAPGLVKASW